MKRYALALLSLLLAVVLAACGSLPVETTPITTTPAETTPSETTPAVPDDPHSALRASEEAWILHGLEAYESGKDPADLSSSAQSL